MGTAIFAISKYGDKSQKLRGRLVASGDHNTSTSATNLTDGAAGGGSAVTATKGDVLTIRTDTTARVHFGGLTATATVGQPVFVDETTDLEIPASGAISIIDLA